MGREMGGRIGEEVTYTRVFGKRRKETYYFFMSLFYTGNTHLRSHWLPNKKLSARYGILTFMFGQRCHRKP